MTFCFIVLHYKNINETIKCISSIQVNFTEYRVVIIDNASNDGTADKPDAQRRPAVYPERILDDDFSGRGDLHRGGCI